jgi:hypothetical protein
MRAVLFSDICEAVLIMTGKDVLGRDQNRDVTMYRKAVAYLTWTKLMSSKPEALKRQNDIANLLMLSKSTLSIQLNDIQQVVSMKGLYATKYRNMLDRIWEMSSVVRDSITDGVNASKRNNMIYAQYQGTASCMKAISEIIVGSGLTLRNTDVSSPTPMKEVLRFEADGLWVPTSSRAALMRSGDYILWADNHLRVIDKIAFEQHIFGR